MLSPIRLSRLSQAQAAVDDQGRPVSVFLRYFNDMVQRIEAAFNGIIAAQNAADAAQGTANGRLTQGDGDARYVKRDATPTWAVPTGTPARSYTGYAGQTIGNPPTQAQMQAVDDAVKALSQVMVGLLTDLEANDVLSH